MGRRSPHGEIDLVDESNENGAKDRPLGLVKIIRAISSYDVDQTVGGLMPSALGI